VENKNVSFAKFAVGLRAGLLLSVLTIPSASADSLNDAFVKAYQTNPQLLSERANLRATDEEVSQAIAQWRPTVSVSSDFSRDTTNTKKDPSVLTLHSRVDPWNATIQATQTVFAGGRILAQRSAGDLFLDKAIIRRVRVEGGNHIIAIGPRVGPLRVHFKTRRIRITHDIEPMLRPALTVAR
jgi:hypothetical protein